MKNYTQTNEKQWGKTLEKNNLQQGNFIHQQGKYEIQMSHENIIKLKGKIQTNQRKKGDKC